ncbi:MAG TPA: RIP metalloprotease RseP [Candidatus Angelobacter sp.]|nr:RIP metalloprotease RseP [Candidatus Angelobacter sp.]
MSFLISPVAVALVLGILVFIHEFGHYAAAKLCGVRVETFSLGFGKRLFGFRRGGTDYRISLLPIGGYVKMAGENPMEERTGDPGEFMSHPRWQRFLIAAAGPAMNILLTLAILTGVYTFHYQRPAYSEGPAVVGIVEHGSAAEKAGILPGDKIVRLQDLQNPSWEDILPKVLISPEQTMDVVVQRDGQELTLHLTPKTQEPDRVGDAGWSPRETVVAVLEPNMPAAKAGLQVGDVITAINGTAVSSMKEMIDLLQQNKDKPAQIAVLRQDKELKFSVTPQFTGESYRIGSSPFRTSGLPFAVALDKALRHCKADSTLVFQLVGKLLRSKVSPRVVSGPVGIVKITSEVVAMHSWLPLVMLMALISLQLAIFNLFPIPILDGGLMLMLLIEATMRRDIKQEVKERVYQVAFVFLILIAAVVMYNDIAKSLPGWSLP